jgi:plastocyanin
MEMALAGLLALAIPWAGLAAGSGTFAVTLTARNMAFDQSTLTVPAGADVTLRFANNDSGVPHNVAIYETPAAATVIFQGKVIPGPQSITYTFTAPTRPGTYFFRCDVHPETMTGAFVVVPAVTLDLTAQQMAFDKRTLSAPAGAYVSVHFQNGDAGVPHTFSLYETQAAETVLFRGQAVTGPATADYAFFAPEKPGKYFFRCDVHPSTMTGDFVVVASVAVTLTAKHMAFDRTTVAVPADAYVLLHFTNEDSGVPHNVAAYTDSSARTPLFQGAIVTGPAAIDYAFFAPEKPGKYFFRCDVHPSTMIGVLDVTAAGG